jgi:hypothetical protein
MESSDLSATVGKKFVRPNCALTYPVHVVCRLRFSEYFRTVEIFEPAPDGVLIGEFAWQVRYRWEGAV